MSPEKHIKMFAPTIKTNRVQLPALIDFVPWTR